MLPPRLPVLSALLLLLLAADARSAPEPSGRFPRPRTETSALTGPRAAERERRPHHWTELDPKDSRYKEKFIRHLTGPLYFSPKCKKDFNNLYHNTRECTLPAYYKRCARLLIRLASIPRCKER